MNPIVPERSQCASRILMVRPDRFAYHARAAGSNAFMHEPRIEDDEVARRALDEFDALASAIERAGVRVLVHRDRDGLPDSVFPNNWFSWHEPVDAAPVLITYPMHDPLRRRERRSCVLDAAIRFTGLEPSMMDLSALEEQGDFLEGTGSLVLDRVRGVALACRSARTTERALVAFEQRTGYEVFAFDASDPLGCPIYHTNVICSIGASVGVVCASCIGSDEDRGRVLGAAGAGGRAVIELEWDQVGAMCGNMLELRAGSGDPVFVMSSGAFATLTDEQRALLGSLGRLVHAPIPTIERVGGGSARCMIAELGNDSTPIGG